MQQRTIPTKGIIRRVAEIEISAPVEKVFNYLSAEESLPEFLKRYGPVHAIEKWETHKGPWSFAGAYRTLYFEGGDTLREELLSFHPPTYFAYSIGEFSSSVKHLSDAAYGEFAFQARGNDTIVTWTYSFKPKNFVTGIPLSIFMSMYFKKYMEQGLHTAKKYIEAVKPIDRE